MDIVYTLLKIFLILLAIVTIINIINYFVFPETFLFSYEDMSLINLFFIGAALLIFIFVLYRKYKCRKVLIEDCYPIENEFSSPVIVDNKCSSPVIVETSPVIVETSPVIVETSPVIVEKSPIILSSPCRCNNESNKIYHLRKLSNGIYIKVN